MKLFVCDGRSALRRIEVPTPEPGPGQVRVAVAAVGVCASDVECFDGRRVVHQRYGHPVIGHEVAGTIDAVGVGVGGLRAGDRVACVETWGALADYVIAYPLHLLRFSPRLAFEDACLLEVLPGIAMAAWRSGISRESRVLVVGQGLSGLLITRCVHLHGCHELVVVDPDPEKLAIAAEFGADATVRGTLPTDDELVKEEGQFDVAIVATPGAEALRSLVTLVRPRGRIVLYGGLVPDAQLDLYAVHRRSISLVKESGGVQGVLEARQLWRQALQLVEDGVLSLSRLRTHTFPMADAEAALRLRAGHVETALHVVLRNGDP